MLRRAAFTLIELLVVIAIIAVIAAILFPVFSRAREKARAATCLSNMRQLNSALAMYAQDNDETFPGYAGTIKLLTEEQPAPDTPIWTTFLMPYVHNEGMVVCPSASNSKFAGVWKDRGTPSIGYNTHFGEWFIHKSDDTRTALRVRLAQMSSPAVNVTFGDGSSGNTDQTATNDPRGYAYRGYIISNWDTRSGGCGQATVINGGGDTLSDRHSGGTNLALADGHAKWFPTSRLLPDGSAPPASDNCFCIADRNPARLKWLVVYACSTD